MDSTLDRFDIVDTTVRMAWHADRREWDALSDVFAPQVRLDYTSLTGGEAATVERGDLIGSWRNALGGLSATQHLVGNHLVTPTLGGHYRFELSRASEGWRITDLTMTADWAAGNQQIMTLAAAR
jgi:hypothetical protein